MTDGAFLAACTQALRSSTGAEALDELGWWDLLADLKDAEARTAVFSAFRAQGRALATSSALAGLVAVPYLLALDAAPATAVAAIARRSARRGPVLVLCGDLGARQILVDQPGRGAFLLRPDQVELRPVDLPGGLDLHEVTVGVDLESLLPDLPEDAAAEARARSEMLGRVAAALEMLGAAEGALGLALEHAADRQQFGAPIGTFQAVRHLLAWAKADCEAIDAVAAAAVALDEAAPAGYGEVVKALAGRNARRACERALQVLGGIGFTSEHDHHRFHSRVLALDSLLGTSAELAHRAGERLRTTGHDPGIPAALILGRHP